MSGQGCPRSGVLSVIAPFAKALPDLAPATPVQAGRKRWPCSSCEAFAGHLTSILQDRTVIEFLLSTLPMSYLLPLLGLALVHLLAVASPGPSFVLVARLAAARSRRSALLAALAMMCGALVWAAAALLGLQALFARFETLYLVLRIVGGAYLVWLAIQIFRHAGDALPLADPQPEAGGSERTIFRHALLVQLSNPKIAVFFGTIFVALLPVDPPLWVLLAMLLIVCVNELGWFTLVALLFSAGPAQRLYRRAQRWLDRATGLVLGGLGLRLILDHR
jgi:RhtB (resistance to homoserine/threonine) family protein